MSYKNFRVLPYLSDSEPYMRALNDVFELPAYLDSSSHGGDNGSLDILAAAPTAYMKIEDGDFSCSENATQIVERSIDSQKFINNIRLLKEEFLPASSYSSDATGSGEVELDHAGSVIAFLGYPNLKGKANFEIIDAYVGIYLWVLVVDHASESCELRFHPSCDSPNMDRVEGIIRASLAAPSAEPRGFSLESAFMEGTSAAQYREAFTQIMSHIDCGDCYQVNLTQSFAARGYGEPLEAYLRLRQATRAPFSAYISWGDNALLSLSPERFLSVVKKAVLTQPIKGTRPRGMSASEDERQAHELAVSEKDIAENLMIVDLLRNDLGRVCESVTIDVNQLFMIESFSNVHHLVSNVAGRLRSDLDPLDLLDSCYPGGSITGAPKLSAMRIIEELERDARQVYCGTVFYLGMDDKFDSSITIRSLFWQAGVLRCWAGGGIVADSDCDQEYQECFDKINNIFNALQSSS
jgi:para-aminobenzoate synthetase component I